ncbi:MAG: ATP-grasp domain-containing protein [Flavobacteriaceae bacterium]|nr:ATP-grasp domain-containing protein [Flavobacteriaceae bacterium]
MSTKLNVLIPDGESTWAKNVIQCFNKNSSYDFHVLSGEKKTAIKYSNNIASFGFRPLAKDSQERLDWINEVIDEREIAIILPIAEKIMELLLANVSKINPKAKMVPLSSKDKFKIAIHKNLLYDFMLANEIAAPKSFKFNHLHELVSVKEHLRFPVLLKPINGKGGEGIIRFDAYEDLSQYVSGNANLEDAIIQELIMGYDIDCSVLCENGKILTYTIQKGFIPRKTPYMPQLGIEFIQNDEVLRTVSKLMAALDWNGVAHIDLIYDEKEKNYKVLEVNGRFWGSLLGSKKVGVNFPELILRKTEGYEVEHLGYETKKVIIFKGYFKYFAQKPWMIFSPKVYTYRSTFDSFLKDPKPSMFRLWEYLIRSFK